MTTTTEPQTDNAAAPAPDGSIWVNAHELRRALRAVRGVMDRGGHIGVHLTTSDGALYVTATDRYTLASYLVPLLARPTDEAPPAPAAVTAQISRYDARALAGTLRGSTADDVVEIDATSSAVSLRINANRLNHASLMVVPSRDWGINKHLIGLLLSILASPEPLAGAVARVDPYHLGRLLRPADRIRRRAGSNTPAIVATHLQPGSTGFPIFSVRVGPFAGLAMGVRARDGEAPDVWGEIAGAPAARPSSPADTEAGAR